MDLVLCMVPTQWTIYNTILSSEISCRSFGNVFKPGKINGMLEYYGGYILKKGRNNFVHVTIKVYNFLCIINGFNLLIIFSRSL